MSAAPASEAGRSSPEAAAAPHRPWGLAVRWCVAWAVFSGAVVGLEAWLWRARDGLVRVPPSVAVLVGSLADVPGRALLCVTLADAAAAMIDVRPRGHLGRVRLERVMTALLAAAQAWWLVRAARALDWSDATRPSVVTRAALWLVWTLSLLVARRASEAITRSGAAHGPWLLLAVGALWWPPAGAFSTGRLLATVGGSAGPGVWWRSIAHLAVPCAAVVGGLLAIGRWAPRGPLPLARGAGVVSPFELIAAPGTIEATAHPCVAFLVGAFVLKFQRSGVSVGALADVWDVAPELIPIASSLLGVGVVALWLSRRPGSARARWPRRLAAALAAATALALAPGCAFPSATP